MRTTLTAFQISRRSWRFRRIFDSPFALRPIFSSANLPNFNGLMKQKRDFLVNSQIIYRDGPYWLYLQKPNVRSEEKRPLWRHVPDLHESPHIGWQSWLNFFGTGTGSITESPVVSGLNLGFISWQSRGTSSRASWAFSPGRTP
jgi:hypothetical protein